MYDEEMKSLHKIFCLLLFIWTCSTVCGQQGHGLIARHIESAATGQLAAHFTENIDMTILEQDAVYSRAQAEMVLKRFFKNDRPVEFTIEHQGSAPGECRYVIGRLTTDEHLFRVTYFQKLVDDSPLIKQFSIAEYE